MVKIVSASQTDRRPLSDEYKYTKMSIKKKLDVAYLLFGLLASISLFALILGLASCRSTKPCYTHYDTTVLFTPIDSIDSLDYEQAIWAQENHKL